MSMIIRTGTSRPRRGAGRALAALLAITGPLAAPAAMAATESAAEGGLEEVIVSAQFREQNLQDTPLAITAVTADLLEARSQTNLTDVAEQAPSVVLRPVTSAFGNSITASIRGMGQIDFNPQLEPGVGLYIDDVYYPRLTGANFDLLDVERVEILRGPQGTLTGRNSEGGAIKFVSRKPVGDGSGFAEATYGSRKKLALRAGLDIELGGDFAARLTGAFKEQGGFVNRLDYNCVTGNTTSISTIDDDCVVDRLGNTSYRALRGTLRYHPSERVDVIVSGDFVRDTRNNSAEVLLYLSNANPNVQTSDGLPADSRFICGPLCNYAQYGHSAGTFIGSAARPDANGVPLAATSANSNQLYEGWGVSGNAEIRFTDRLQLTSISAYREFRNYFVNDAELSPVRVNFGINDVNSDFFSQELRLNVDATRWLQLTVGAYYSEETTVYDTLQDIRYVSAGPNPLYPMQFLGSNPVDTDSKALFGTAILKPIDALTVTLGARYTEESKSTLFGRYNYDGVTPNRFVDPIGAAYGIGYSGPDTLDSDGDLNTTEVVTALTGRLGTSEADRIDYRGSIDYRFSEQILAYATVATGFKGGGISPRPFNAGQVQPFDPEELTSYELGLKTDLFDRRVRLNLAAYYNDLSGAQLTLLSCPQFGGPGPCALPQNAGDATVKGVEIEIVAHPIDGLDFNGSLSYLNFEWDCVVPTVVDRTADPAAPCSSAAVYVDRLNAPQRGVAELQWSAGLQYRLQLGAAGSLTPRLDISHQGEIPSGVTVPTPGSPSELYGTIEAYTLANARLTWNNADNDISVALAVTNLADRYYFVNKFDLVGAGAGFITGALGAPREWSLTVKKSF